MEKKLIIKPGRYAQIWVALFASIGASLMFSVFVVLGAINNDIGTVTQMLIAIACSWGGIWLIFLLVVIFKRSVVEITEDRILKRTKKKVLWEIEWSEVSEVNYYKMNLLRLLLLSFSNGDLIITYNKAVIKPRPGFSIPSKGSPTIGFSVFPKDAKKIKELFGKEINFH